MSFRSSVSGSIDTIDSGDILKVLTPIWTVKPETARRLKQRMKLVFDWAKASGFCTGDNPTEGLTKVLPKHKGDKQHHRGVAVSGRARHSSPRCRRSPTCRTRCGSGSSS